MLYGKSVFFRVAMMSGASAAKNAMKGCRATASIRFDWESPKEAPTIVTNTLTSTSE